MTPRRRSWADHPAAPLVVPIIGLLVLVFGLRHILNRLLEPVVQALKP